MGRWRVAVGTAGLLVATGAAALAIGGSEPARVVEVEPIAETVRVGDCRALAGAIDGLLDGGRLTRGERVELAALQEELAGSHCGG